MRDRSGTPNCSILSFGKPGNFTALNGFESFEIFDIFRERAFWNLDADLAKEQPFLFKFCRCLTIAAPEKPESAQTAAELTGARLQRRVLESLLAGALQFDAFGRTPLERLREVGFAARTLMAADFENEWCSPEARLLFDRLLALRWLGDFDNRRIARLLAAVCADFDSARTWLFDARGRNLDFAELREPGKIFVIDTARPDLSAVYAGLLCAAHETLSRRADGAPVLLFLPKTFEQQQLGPARNLKMN